MNVCTRCGADRSYEQAMGDQSGQCWRPDCRTAPIGLPSCTAYQLGETVVDHGARVLAFLFQTSCTATLSDLELERAEIAAKYAIVARGISVTAADRISDVRHVIAIVLKDRKRAELERVQLAALGTDTRPNQGPMAPLLDRPIVRPPSGDTADYLQAVKDVLQPQGVKSIQFEGKDRIQF